MSISKEQIFLFNTLALALRYFLYFLDILFKEFTFKRKHVQMLNILTALTGGSAPIGRSAIRAMCLAEIMLVSKGTKKQNAKLGKGSEQERLFVNKYSKTWCS